MKQAKRFRLSDDLLRLIIFIVIFAVFAVLNPNVVGIANLVSLFNNMVYTGILALGLMMLLVLGTLDLGISAYAVFGAYGTLSFCMTYWMGANLWIMLLSAAILGGLAATVTGALIYKLKLPGILVSVATSNIFYMLLFLSGYGTGNVPATKIPPHMLTFNKTNLFSATVGRITVQMNISVLVMLILAVLLWIFLNKTMTGRNIYAIGGNYEAAERMGINIFRTYIIVFFLAGALAGIAGMQSYMKQMSVTPLGLQGSHSNALAACIFGGTQLGNGKGGSVVGTMIGVMTITLISTSLVMLGVPSYAQTFVIGVLILASVVLAASKNIQN